MYDLETKEGMANAMQWTQKLFDTMGDKGVWAVPRSGTVVQLDKPNKAVVIEHLFAPDECIAQVIEAIGWTVTTKGDMK